MFPLPSRLRHRLSLRSSGPFALTICPSRELARQTWEVAEEYCEGLHRGGFPRLRTLLCIGGIAIREQLDSIRNGGRTATHINTHTHTHTHIHTHDAPRRVFDFARVSGVHLIVSTPGRLKDLLEKKKINLDL